MGEKQRSTIQMSDDEVLAFLHQSRTATMATVGANGTPHLVAMWYAASTVGCGLRQRPRRRRS